MDTLLLGHIVVVGTTAVLIVVCSLMTWYRLLSFVSTGLMWLVILLNLGASALFALTLPAPPWMWLWRAAPWLMTVRLALIVALVLLLASGLVCRGARCGKRELLAGLPPLVERHRDGAG
jgi:hypothetical protein